MTGRSSEAVKSSSGLMEVVEQGDKIRRSPSKSLLGAPKKTQKEIIARTVCAKPFPLNVKLDDLLEFFEGYGHVVKIWVMKRRFLKKTIVCVYVTFSNKEEAAKFVSEEETKFKKQAVKVKRFKTKCRKHKAAKKITKGKKDTEGKQHKKCEDETKEEETEADLEKKVSQTMIKNAVIHLKGLNYETSRHQVRAFFSKYADVVWVYIIKDAAECRCYIRLLKPDSAGSTLEKAKTANDGKIIINDSEIEVRVVVGDEELQYWKKAIKNCEDKKKRGAWGWGWSRKQDGRNQVGGQNLIDMQINRVVPQGKRKLKRKDASSDGEEQDTEEPPAKVIKSEIIIKFNTIIKLHDASSDGEEHDTKKPAPSVTKSEMAITRPEGKRKQNRKDASSDGEEQNTEEPPAKVIKSDMIIKFNEVIKLHDVSSDEEAQDIKEPALRVIKSEMIITGPQNKSKQNRKDASSDGEEQDTEEPPAKVIKSDMIINFNQVMKLSDALSDGEEDKKESAPRVNKSEMAITGPQGKRKQQTECSE